MKTCLALLLAVTNIYSISGCLPTCPIIFTFGRDRSYYKIIFESRGTIGIFEKNIVIKVPECGVKYVEVKIQNVFSTPAVRYDYDNAEIVIRYGWLELSSSSYDVIVKGNACNKGKKKKLLRRPCKHANCNTKY